MGRQNEDRRGEICCPVKGFQFMSTPFPSTEVKDDQEWKRECQNDGNTKGEYITHNFSPLSHVRWHGSRGR